MQLGDTCSLLDRWITQSLAMKKGLRYRSKPWVTPIHASVKLAGLNFHAFDLLNVDRIAIEKCVCWALLFSIRARESKRGEREKCLEAKKMKENVNTETFGLFFYFYFLYGKSYVKFEYIVFGLNGFLVKTQ